MPLLHGDVFSTKPRQRRIDGELEPRLHAYLGGIVRNLEGVASAVSRPTSTSWRP